MGRTCERLVYNDKGHIVSAKCCRCKEVKDIYSFYRSGNGLPYHLCKQCVKEVNTIRKKGNKAEVLQDNVLYKRDVNGKITHKLCRKCNEYKPISEYYFDKRKETYHSYCSVCKKEMLKKYTKKYARIYKGARRQKPEFLDIQEDNSNSNYYKGVYVLINPEKRSYII